MKTSQKNFVVILLIILAVVVAGGVYIYSKKPAQNPNPTTSPNPDVITYDNFGISFQYPSRWGIPKENLYNGNLQSVSFGDYSPSGQPLTMYVGRDTNPEGTALLDETFDQMIQRFRANNPLIYDVKDVRADGVAGKEVFSRSAVTGKPYHTDAYFPLENGSYIIMSADYESVRQSMFDMILATLKWDKATISKTDPKTGMSIYTNNGIRFAYPVTFTTDYASFTLEVGVEKIDRSKLDENGCYPGEGDEEAGDRSHASIQTINGVKFCYSTGTGVGAGQRYTTYRYTTFRNDNAYSIAYVVHTSNGCGAYYGTPQYSACQAAANDYTRLVLDPIRQSIGTFSFTQNTI